MSAIDLQELARVYNKEMSAGDRSCVMVMLQRPGGQQATTEGSGHCRFYEILTAADWARRDTASTIAKAAPFIRVFELTDLGRTRLTAVLPVLGHV